ncbi:unnamed protein product [Discosporangium mesarthrocarpum]
MYCGGDDIGAVVGDVGSYSCKIGFAGEDFPRAYFSSLVGRTAVGDTSDQLDAAMDIAVNGSPAKAGNQKASGKVREERPQGTQSPRPGRADRPGSVGAGVDTSNYEWHVDSLLSRTDMEMMPVVEAGQGECWSIGSGVVTHLFALNLVVSGEETAWVTSEGRVWSAVKHHASWQATVSTTSNCLCCMVLG